MVAIATTAHQPAQPPARDGRRERGAPKPSQPPRESPAVAADTCGAARAAGLRYVSDALPGIRREQHREALRYVDPRGRAIDDEDTLRRIHALAIPPAWTDVWICPDPNGHLQATGRDAKGRKQYRYHRRWREVRDETKYHRLIAFAHALPAIRERTAHDLALPGLPREKVLAAIVRLLETTHIRVGNEEYARHNRSFGLTTLRTRHVDVSGGTIRFHFRGKSGKTHEVTLRDQKLARIVRRCRDLPGYELFQYVDEHGERQRVDAGDVNTYLRTISGQDFTAKDFRTWTGTVLAALELGARTSVESETRRKRAVVQAVESVAAQLGNTPAVCRKCYVHPSVIEAYQSGSLAASLKLSGQSPQLHTSAGAEAEMPSPELGAAEAAVLALLEEHLTSNGA